jgi:hypothetical protein
MIERNCESMRNVYIDHADLFDTLQFGVRSGVASFFFFPAPRGRVITMAASNFLLPPPPRHCRNRVDLDASRTYTVTHHSRYDSSGRVIGPSQRPLPDNTHIPTRDRHPCPRRNSNPQSQHASGRRPSP